MSENKVNIGIILGSTREGRVSPQVGQWIYELGQKRTDATFEIIDIKAFDLPFLGTTDDKTNIQNGMILWLSWMDLCL